ncbi:MAG: ubiquinol oxidase subunit II [Candidatus Microsaccharimonas sp.]
MRKRQKTVAWRALQVFISSFVTVAIIGIFVFVTQGRDIPVLNPSGTIADQQLVLLLITTALGVLVIVPVFILLFVIAWRYRAGNKKAKYEPEMKDNVVLEVIWWGIPVLIIIALSIITHISTHALDPYKPLESNVKPVKVQVISLNWRWLFIYPDYGVATMSHMPIPKDTPINLSISADSPMNSFWVPALAGQIYAMNGMTTKLHMMADSVGTYNGFTTNISGEGYAHMRFKVYAQEEADFEAWAKQALQSKNVLSSETYKEISKDSKDTSEKTYLLQTPELFDQVIMKYMEPAKTTGSNTHGVVTMGAGA